VAGQSAHQVQRQRQNLQGDEHGQQIPGGPEQHHAGDGEHGQREHLGLGDAGLGGDLLGLAARNRGRLRGEAVQSAVRSVPLGDEQHPQDRDHQDGTLQEQSRTVDDHGPDRRELPGTGAQSAVDADHADEGRQQPGQAEGDLDRVAAAAGQERLDEDAGHGDAEHDEHREQHAVFDAGRGHSAARSAGAGSVWPIRVKVSVTAGLMTSRAGFG
jgi:hypothetical protein